MVETSDLAPATHSSFAPRIPPADRQLLTKRIDPDLKMITLTRPRSNRTPCQHPIYITTQDGKKHLLHMPKSQMVKLTSSPSKVSTSNVLPKLTASVTVSKMHKASIVPKVSTAVSKAAPFITHLKVSGSVPKRAPTIHRKVLSSTPTVALTTTHRKVPASMSKAAPSTTHLKVPAPVPKAAPTTVCRKVLTSMSKAAPSTTHLKVPASVPKAAPTTVCRKVLTSVPKVAPTTTHLKVPASVPKMEPSTTQLKAPAPVPKAAPSTACRKVLTSMSKVAPSTTHRKVPASMPKAAPSTAHRNVPPKVAPSPKNAKVPSSKKAAKTGKKRKLPETVAVLKRKLPPAYNLISEEKIRRLCLHKGAIDFFNNNPYVSTGNEYSGTEHNSAAQKTAEEDELPEMETVAYQLPSEIEGGLANPLLSSCAAATLTTSDDDDDDVTKRLTGTSRDEEPSSSLPDFAQFEPSKELPELPQLEISQLLEEPNKGMEHYHYDPYVAAPDYPAFPAINALSYEEYHHPHAHPQSIQPLPLTPYETYPEYPYDFTMYSRASGEVFSPTYTSPSPHYHPHSAHALPNFNDGYAYHDEFQPPQLRDARSPHHYQASPAATPRFMISQQQQDGQQMQEYIRSTGGSSSSSGSRFTSGEDIQLALGGEPMEHIITSKKVQKHRNSDVDDSGVSSPGSSMSANTNTEQIHEEYVNSPYPALMQQQPPYSPSHSASVFKPYSLTNLDEYTAKVKEEPKYTDLDGVKNLEEAVAMIGIGQGQSPLGHSMDRVGSVESTTSSIDTVVEVIKPKVMEYTMEKYAYKKRSGNTRKPSKANGKTMPLWEFILDKLFDPRCSPSMIKWENRKEGVFRLVQSDKIAAMWGRYKNNEKMTYEKLSRAMRYYYEREILERVDGKRLVYKFGNKSSGWRIGEVCGKIHDPYQHHGVSPPSTPLMIDIAPAAHQHSPQSTSTSSVDSSKWVAVGNCQSPASLPGANVLLAANSI